MMAKNRQTLSAEKAQADAWQMVLRAYPKLAAILPRLPFPPLDPPVPPRYDPEKDVLGDVFADIIHHPADHGLNWLPTAYETIEKQMQKNEGQAAITTAFYVIHRLQIQVTALALALHSDREAIGKPTARKELKRRFEKRKKDIERKGISAQAKTLTRKLYAEYAPADVKRFGKAAVCKDIAGIVQRQLELAKPYDYETVRKFLSGLK